MMQRERLCIVSVFCSPLFSFFLRKRTHRERSAPGGDRNHSALVSRSMTTVSPTGMLQCVTPSVASVQSKCPHCFVFLFLLDNNDQIKAFFLCWKHQRRRFVVKQLNRNVLWAAKGSFVADNMGYVTLYFTHMLDKSGKNYVL